MQGWGERAEAPASETVALWGRMALPGPGEHQLPSQEGKAGVGALSPSEGTACVLEEGEGYTLGAPPGLWAGDGGSSVSDLRILPPGS